MPYIHFSDRHYPLVIYSYKGGADYEDALPGWDFTDEILRRGRPYSIVADLHEAAMPTARYKTGEEARIKSIREDLDRLNVSVAIVLPHPLLRMGMSMLLMASPLPMPQKVFSTAEKAVDWTSSILGGAGCGAVDCAAVLETIFSMRRGE